MDAGFIVLIRAIPESLALICCAVLLLLTGCAGTVSPGLDFSAFKPQAGLAAEVDVPDLVRLSSAPRWSQALPLYRQWMSRPFDAPLRASILGQALSAQAESPADLFVTLAGLSGVELARPLPPWLLDQETVATDARLRQAWTAIWQTSESGETDSVPPLPEIPEPLRLSLAQLLTALVAADRLRTQAFADWPARLTPLALMEQAVLEGVEPFAPLDYRLLLSRPDHPALHAAMQDLAATVAQVSAQLAAQSPLPAWYWRVETPLGVVLVDTSAQSSRHDLRDVLLVIDAGGDDRYHFDSSHHPRRGRVRALIDLQGNDRYVSVTPAADPSSAVMGVGVMIDLAGDDVYQGTHLTQGAALFGNALLVDGGGRDVFNALGHAQAFALAGTAALVSLGGDDRYTALTHAQASAGPAAVAVLIDRAGDDRYRLDNAPLISPSAQSSAHNVSMGQGAARGVRADHSDGRSLAGGLALLLDEAGDDHYHAQVFAQGAGFWESVGVLLDGAGNDHYEGVWYVQGAAAHRAFGLLHDHGGNDRHQASHSTALGAAHDLSVGMLVNGSGDDDYRLGTLGLGAAHDGSLAVLADLAGDDAYAVNDPRCRALGAAVVSGWNDLRPWLPNLGLFIDFAGQDRYPALCPDARDEAVWQMRRIHPDRLLPGESAVGQDGDAPFLVR